jgi:hypothetical protein
MQQCLFKLSELLDISGDLDSRFLFRERSNAVTIQRKEWISVHIDSTKICCANLPWDDILVHRQLSQKCQFSYSGIVGFVDFTEDLEFPNLSAI